ncbi:MAG: HNH endonuclease [Gammaproteobacteria bacterium]|nr:HNH endonuclease [Gammaproteobacteria bacterium]
MATIFVAPVDSDNDQTQLDRSIVNPVERQVIIQNFSDATYPELIDIERRGRGFYAWGLPADENNVDQWFHMGVGDFVLLTYQGDYRHYGKVLGRYENSRAATAIWGDPDEPEEVRELLFFLSEPISLSLPRQQLTDYIAANYSRFQQVPSEAMERIEADFGSIERFFRRRLLNTSAGGPVLDMSGIIRLSEREQARVKAFDPGSTKDGRAMIVEAITKRRGYPTLRQTLLNAYEHQCAITGCNAVEALEVTYIIPYRGKYTHSPSNGILLRADLHTLFDLGKIAIDTRTMTVILNDELMDSSYRILTDRPLNYPKDETKRPSKEALDLHRRLVGL